MEVAGARTACGALKLVSVWLAVHAVCAVAGVMGVLHRQLSCYRYSCMPEW